MDPFSMYLRLLDMVTSLSVTATYSDEAVAENQEEIGDRVRMEVNSCLTRAGIQADNKSVNRQQMLDSLRLVLQRNLEILDSTS